MTKVKINLLEIKKDIKSYAEKAPIIILQKLLEKANHYYFNTEQSLFSDFEYDILKEILEIRDPENTILKEIGAPLIGEKAELPCHMGSMNKKKSKKMIGNWLTEYLGPEYLISEKLDGTSCLYVNNGSAVSLFTRGHGGTVGRNISHFYKYINIPKNISKNIKIRGEVIISKSNFKKYKDLKTDARCMINGLTVKKTPCEELRDVDFVAYEVISPELDTPAEQFKFLKKLGFKYAKNEILKRDQIMKLGDDNTKGSTLFNKIIDYKLKSEYEIDGLIVADNNYHDKTFSGNPKNSFAYKINDEGKITKVVKVEWNPSKYATLVPRVEIEPITFGNNITVKHAAAHNARYICENNIGPGAILRVIRSGDVIPYIIEVKTPAEKPQLPDINYKWNSTKVNIILENPTENPDHYLKKISNFFGFLGIENLSSCTIKKLIDNSYDTIPKILSITKKELLTLPNIKDKMANKLYDNIHKVIDNPIPLSTLMAASLKFGHGYGITRFEAILNHYPNILNIDNLNIDMICSIPGFQEKTAKQFVDNLENFKSFIKTIPMIQITSVKEKEEIKGNKFQDQNIVFTGFTSSNLENFIRTNMGTVSGNVNSKTTLVITKDKTKESTKLSKAKKLNIPIMSLDDFNMVHNL